MIGKRFFKTAFLIAFLASFLHANEENCNKKGENYLYVEKECLQLAITKTEDSDTLNIILHGTWDRGTNTLGRYAPFAESLNMITDFTTVAIALPGYSNSTTNSFPSLDNDEIKNLAAKREYVEFVAKVIQKLKEKYDVETINFIGHSAGAMIGATITGLYPDLINNIALAGGRYDIHEVSDAKDLISAVDVIDDISKETKILLIYGTEDKISKPEVTKSFYKLAKDKGLLVKLVEVKGAPHLDLDMHDTSVEAITELLEQ